jgi:hypothetical protein
MIVTLSGDFMWRYIKRLWRRFISTAWSWWKCFVDFAAAEWVLTRCEVPNGGSVVLFRAVWVTSWAAIFLLPGSNVVFPGMGITPILPLIGVVFGTVYASFYTRYASQWTYLANIYHRIKETESRARDRDEPKLAEWKAGFIEDVEELHLVAKPLFASVILYWLQEPAVRNAYEQTTLGCPQRLFKLHARVRLACIKEERRRLGR